MTTTTRGFGEMLAAWYEGEEGVRGVPRGSQDGPPIERYGLPRERPDNWCARMARHGIMTVSRVLDDNSVSARDLYESGAAAYLCALLLRLGFQYVPLPKRGRLCFVSKGGALHHVGCVVWVAADGKRFDTVDGNWDDAVERNARDPLGTEYVFLKHPGDT